MKRTAKSWVLFAIQLIFMIVVPCVFIWVQYGDLTGSYKVSVTAILLTILVFLVFKKIFIDKWLKTIDQKKANIETNALSVTDEASIKTNKKAWRNYAIVQLAISSVVPILVLVLATITIKTVEEGLIKLFGVLVFSLISIASGVVFRVGEIYSMKLPHEKKTTEK